MQIYRFSPDTAHPIDQYETWDAAITHVAGEIPNAHIAVMYIGPGGLVGYHQAAGDQLFMVVQGSGWVAGADRRRTELTAGQAAFWQAGEWHESGSDSGMTAVIVEAEKIDPTG